MIVRREILFIGGTASGFLLAVVAFWFESTRADATLDDLGALPISAEDMAFTIRKEQVGGVRVEARIPSRNVRGALVPFTVIVTNLGDAAVSIKQIGELPRCRGDIIDCSDGKPQELTPLGEMTFHPEQTIAGCKQGLS